MASASSSSSSSSFHIFFPLTPVGWFDLDSLPIMQQARRNRLAAAKAGFDVGLPFNELNRIIGLGFKSLPWGNDGFVSCQLQKLSVNQIDPSQSTPRPNV